MKRILIIILIFALLSSFMILFSSCFNKVNLTFVTFHESNCIYLDVEKGKRLEFFPNISRTGYNFLGWSLSDTEPIIIDREQVFYEDTTLYAYYEIIRTEYTSYTMVYDGTNSYERYLANGMRRILIENKNNSPIKQITLSPAENSNFENWYINATDELVRDLINISEDKETAIFEAPTYGDVIIEFETFNSGRAVITIN